MMRNFADLPFVDLSGNRDPKVHGFDFHQKVWICDSSGNRIKGRIAPHPDKDYLWWESEVRKHWWMIPVTIKTPDNGLYKSEGIISFVHVELLQPRGKS